MTISSGIDKYLVWVDANFTLEYSSFTFFDIAFMQICALESIQIHTDAAFIHFKAQIVANLFAFLKMNTYMSKFFL